MNIDYTSTALFCGRKIDCRNLTIAIEFYLLSRDCVIDMVSEMILWINKLCPLNRFISRQTISNRTTTFENALRTLKSIGYSGDYWSYIFEAFAISPIVYNKKSFAHHMNMLKHNPVVPFLEPSDQDSYLSYWDTLFPKGRESDDQIKAKIMQIFNEKNKRSINFCYHPDVQGYINIQTYSKNSNCFRGRFSFSINVTCLAGTEQSMAEHFREFALHLSEKYIKLNARIMLQPVIGDRGRSPNILYFGSDGALDDSHVLANCSAAEWYGTYYLPGVEWMNIVSPLAQSHFSTLGNMQNKSENLVIKALHGGALLVQSDVRIDEYDVDQSKQIKQTLYPALYPGRSSLWISKMFSRGLYGVPNTHLPRRDWEIVPIFEDEVHIVSTYLVFSYSQNRAVSYKF